MNKQPVTTISAIELSSLCSNKCEYCPAPEQGGHRPTGLMDMDTFRKALEWVKYFARKGTQKELNMQGIGESTMHPDFVEMVHMARGVIPIGGNLMLTTNGNHLNDKLVMNMIDAGITHIILTAHKPRTVKDVVPLLNKYSGRVNININMDFAMTPNNWGGQVKGWTEEVDYRLHCNWLGQGQALIYSDGRITTCCLDAFAQGVVGSVIDEPGSVGVEPFELCKTCHHELPDKYKSGIITNIKEEQHA